MSIKSEIEDFSKKIANDFKREDLKDMLQDLEVDRVGVESEMTDIIESNKKGELNKEIDDQREWALLQGKLFVIEQKRDILLM